MKEKHKSAGNVKRGNARRGSANENKESGSTLSDRKDKGNAKEQKGRRSWSVRGSGRKKESVSGKGNGRKKESARKIADHS